MRFSSSARFCPGVSRRKLLQSWAALVTGAFLVAKLEAQAGGKEVPNRPGEYEVKAALLFHFLQLVDWPKEALSADSQTLTVGVLGHSHCCEPIATALNGKRVKERAIRVLPLTDLQRLGECHLIFLTADESDRARKLLELLKGRPVLTVGESRGFAKGGGILNFYRQERKVRFEVNSAAAERAGLLLASDLLKLGTPVRDDPQPDR